MPDAIPTATIAKPLSKKAQELRDQHYAEYAEALDARDRALERARQGEELCAKASQRISALSDEIADHKARIIGYQLERDEAVAKTTKLETLVMSAMAVLQKSGHVPVTEAEIDFSEVIAKPPTPAEMLQRVK